MYCTLSIFAFFHLLLKVNLKRNLNKHLKNYHTKNRIKNISRQHISKSRFYGWSSSSRRTVEFRGNCLKLKTIQQFFVMTCLQPLLWEKMLYSSRDTTVQCVHSNLINCFQIEDMQQENKIGVARMFVRESSWFFYWKQFRKWEDSEI